MNNTFQVGIIGGGLAGLCSAIHLAKKGISCVVWEKSEFPRHKVCGEYVSNETLHYLNYLGFDPYEYNAVNISEFQVSHWNGDITHSLLGQGAFGISRFVFDDVLCRLAHQAGAAVLAPENVTSVEKQDNFYDVKTNKGSYQVEILISAHGKKSNIDRMLEREFFQTDNDYLGVKYHFRYTLPSHQVSLHNFPNGYCGVSMVEDEKINVCYLTTKTNLKQFSNIDEMEKEVVFQNPYLKDIFTNGDKLFEEPKVISDFSFRPKLPVEDGILMVGDSAGLIPPLCGNGMAMAIHSAYIASNNIEGYFAGKIDRAGLETEYTSAWNKNFKPRLEAGNKLQQLFGKKTISSLALKGLHLAPFLLPAIIKKTHGKDFFRDE